jgi:hypothetical protein
MDPPGTGTVPTIEDRSDVPTICFDIAPTYGVMSGIVQVELGARIFHADGSAAARRASWECRLRCWSSLSPIRWAHQS